MARIPGALAEKVGLTAHLEREEIREGLLSQWKGEISLSHSAPVAAVAAGLMTGCHWWKDTWEPRPQVKTLSEAKSLAEKEEVSYFTPRVKYEEEMMMEWNPISGIGYGTEWGMRYIRISYSEKKWTISWCSGTGEASTFIRGVLEACGV